MVRKNLGRLLIIVAGGGCLAVLIFVVLPMIDEPAPPITQDEIVAQVLGSEEAASDEGELEAVTPSPLVGVWNDGKEVAVNFQAAEPVAGGSPMLAEENRVDDKGLLQALSADDAAAARAAVEGWEAEPVEDLGAEMAEVPEAVPAEMRETGGPVDPGGSGDPALLPADSEAPAAVRVARVGEGKTAGEVSPVVAASEVETTEREAAPVETPEVEAVPLPVETVSAKGAGMRRVVEEPGLRRVEFDLPVPLDPRASRKFSHHSGEVTQIAVSEAGRAGNPGLPQRTMQPGVVVPGTLRGVMGYRLPLVSRQEVPDQIVSGVLIPAHTTFVILKAGSWELVDVTPEELERLREAAAETEAPATAMETARKGWNPLRIFTKRAAPGDE